MKKIKKNKKEGTYKSGEVMSMLEQMNDGINLVAEQHGELSQGIKKLNGEMEEVKNRLNGIDNKLDLMQGDVTEIKHELKRKVYYDEFEKLEKRVIKLEKLALAR